MLSEWTVTFTVGRSHLISDRALNVKLSIGDIISHILRYDPHYFTPEMKGLFSIDRFFVREWRHSGVFSQPDLTTMWRLER